MSVNEKKLRGVLEYCLKNGSIRNGVPKTKLFKLVYLADFTSYYSRGKSITNADYKNRIYGPVPDPLFALVDEMEDCGDIKIEAGERAQFHILEVEPKNIELLDKDEIAILKEVCDYWKNKSANDIVDFVHGQRPWALTKENSVIPYELILQEDHPFAPI